MNPRQVEFYRQDQHDVIHMANRMFVILLILQCIGLIFAAAFITPRTWIGTTSYVHMHLWAAIILGPILTIGPIVLVYLQPTATLTRHVVAAAQVMYSALLIHMTGGRIETHFHVFGSLAFLAFYRDPWVIVSASGLIAVDHAVRGIVAPESVFGVFSSGNWRWVEHAGWVIFEDLFLLISIHRANRMTWDKASLSVDLMKRHEHAERLVAERTVALETALEKAETSSRAKSDFLRNISHEVRTPLNAILGFADLLEFDAQEENKELLQAIQRNGTNLLSMMRQVLALSELESGKSVANKSIVDLQVLCDHLVRKHRPSAEAKELSLTIEDSSVFPKELMSDPQHIETILDHLLHNAVKFTAFGAVQMSVSICEQQRLVSIEVRDTGPGIPPEQCEQLFAAFVQEDASTTREHGGMGLGLAIGRQLALLINGNLTVDSTPGVGSRFKLSLPLQVAPISTVDVDSELPESGLVST